jgi:hypothetical protein
VQKRALAADDEASAHLERSAAPDSGAFKTSRAPWHHSGVDVDELYGLPLDRFVPERTAAARELRKAGDRDGAAEVAALRKPSVAAWAVNQLVRTQRRAVSELLEAGDVLRSAQDDVLAGRGDARSLRAAGDREREAVETLTRAARGLLTSGGNDLSPAIIDRVADTLHAAALDDEAREQVAQGRLERELRHVGLGSLAAGTVPSPAPAHKPAGGRASADEKREREERRRAEEERAKALAEARAAEREAGRRAERAERVTRLAQERRDRAGEALQEAEADLEAAQDELEEAEEKLRDAQSAARELEA